MACLSLSNPYFTTSLPKGGLHLFFQSGSCFHSLGQYSVGYYRMQLTSFTAEFRENGNTGSHSFTMEKKETGI